MQQQGIYPSEKVYLRLADGRVAAVLQNRTLYRRFRASKHLLRKPPALCIDVSFYDAHRALFDTLCFTDVDSGLEYRIPARVFDKYRFVIQRGDYPPQYACLLRYSPLQAVDRNPLAVAELRASPCTAGGSRSPRLDVADHR